MGKLKLFRPIAVFASIPAFFPHIGNDGLANMVMETPEYIPVVCYEVLVFDDVQFISQKACIQIYTVIPICYSFV